MTVVERAARLDEAGRTCPYCHFSLKAGVQVVECGSCGAVHHEECWRENTGCAVTACEAAPATTTSATPARPAGPPPAASSSPPSTAPTSPSVTVDELRDRVRDLLAMPLVDAAGRSAGVAIAVMLAVGFATAAASPDDSAIGIAGFDADLFQETIRATIATTLARFGSSGFNFTLLPLLFVAAPLAGAAWGAVRNAGRTEVLAPRLRLAAGAATGIPLALALLLLSLFAGADDTGFAAASVLLYGLLWGGLGGAAGAALAIGPDARLAVGQALPARALQAWTLVWTALKPLGVLLAIVGAIGAMAWTVQIARGHTFDGELRGKTAALLENPLYVGELAIGNVALGATARFEPLGEGAWQKTLPLPLRDLTEFDGFGERWRIFAYGDNYPPYAYVFVLILLIGLPLSLACYAGFSVVLHTRAATPGAAALHGAAVGAVWAVTMALLRAIAEMRAVNGDSLFLAILLGAGAAGAVGGLLARRPA